MIIIIHGEAKNFIMLNHGERLNKKGARSDLSNVKKSFFGVSRKSNPYCISTLISSRLFFYSQASSMTSCLVLIYMSVEVFQYELVIRHRSSASSKCHGGHSHPAELKGLTLNLSHGA